VHFDDGVVDVDEYRAVDPGEQRGAVVQSGHQPGGDGVELADVTKGELTQERTQRRRGVGPVEQGAHRPVSQQRHVLDAVGPGDHARDQRGHLRPGVGALVGGHAEVHVGQRRQVTLLGQGDHRDQPGAGHQVRVVEDCRRDASSMKELHLRDALRRGRM
jgi:hypothetical protein